ncbi:outer membrane protein assembly factor BamB family protein [Cellulomonas sp. Marseille-Q8402]
MTRPDGMQEVELVASEGAGPDPGPAPSGSEPTDHAARRRRRRRAVLRWWPLGVLAVAAAVGTQLLLDARDRARVAAARQEAGVVGYDVGPDLTTERTDPADLPSAGVRVDELRVVGVDAVSGEPRAVHAVDATSGAEVWRTEVEDAAYAAEIASIESPRCTADDAPGVGVVCFVQDSPATDVGDGGWTVDPPVRSRLLTFDPRTGAVIGERALAPRAAALVVGDDLVLGEVLEDAVRVSAEDAATGSPRWSTDLPVDARALAGIPDMSPYLEVTEAHVVVHLTEQAWAVDRADGVLETTGSQVWVGRDERLITTDPDDALTRLRGTDGSGDVLALGVPVDLAVDDGSVPALDLLTDVQNGDRRLHAVDPRTGEVVWEHALVGPAEGSFILLDDVLYGADGAAVWALDARDGTQVWRTVRDPEAGDVAGSGSAGTWFSPVTDGRQLLLVEQDGVTGGIVEGAPSVLSAWSMASGAHRWTSPLPAEAGLGVWVWDGALYGGWPDRVLVR